MLAAISHSPQPGALQPDAAAAQPDAPDTGGLVGAAAGLREAGWVANGVVGRQAHARAMTRIRVRWQPHAHDARGHGHRGFELLQTQAAGGNAKPCLARGAGG